MEDFKDIKDFEGYYKISNKGQVYHVKHNRMLKGNLISKGYFSVSLSKKSVVTKEYIHRLVALHFVENPFNKPFVNHKNGIRTDNRIENLEWCTPGENIRHAYAIGLVPTWIKARQGGKLTELQVLEIRESNKSEPELARCYNLHVFSIRNIIRKKTWKHI